MFTFYKDLSFYFLWAFLFFPSGSGQAGVSASPSKALLSQMNYYGIYVVAFDYFENVYKFLEFRIPLHSICMKSMIVR